MKLFHRDDVNSFHKSGWFKSAIFVFLFTILMAIPNTSRAAFLNWTAAGDIGSGLSVTFKDVAHGDINGDGRTDLVAATSDGVYAWLQQLEWNCTTEKWAWGYNITAITLPGSVGFGGAGGYFGVVIGDLNKDGFLDVLATRKSYFDVFLGDGTGINWVQDISNPLHTADIGVRHAEVALGDVNNDGIVDLNVVVFNFSRHVRTFIGRGDGDFDYESTVAFSEGKTSSAANYDISNDGRLDYVVALYETALGVSNASIRHLRRNATNDGWVEQAAIVPYNDGTKSGNWQGVVVADLNHDGFADVVAAGGQDDGDNFKAVGDGIQTAGVYVWYGAAGGVWNEAAHPTTTDTYISVHVEDLNNDGYSDIVAGKFGGGISTWLGGAGGIWLADAIPPTAVSSNSVALFDYDNDGNVDLAATDGTSIKIFAQGGGVNSVGWRDFGYPEDSGTFQSVASADFNADGNPDVVAASSAGVNVWYGDGNSSFSGFTSIGIADAYYGVTTGDYNRDGNIDVAAANTSGSNIDIWYGDGAGQWSAQTPIGAGSYTYVTSADVDNDGDIDLIAGSSGSGVNVWKNLSTSFTGVVASPLGGAGSYAGVAVGDFDSNGWLDIAASSTDGNRVHVWRNYTTGFNPTQSGPPVPVNNQVGIENYDGIAIDDFNRDGNLDIVASNSAGEGVQVWYGNGDGTNWRLSYSTPVGTFCNPPASYPIGSYLTATSGNWGVDVYSNYTGSQTVLNVGIDTLDYSTTKLDKSFPGDPAEADPNINYVYQPYTAPFGSQDAWTTAGYPLGLEEFYVTTYYPGVDLGGFHLGVSTGDLDNDGYPDIVVASDSGVKVWMNGGRAVWLRSKSDFPSPPEIWTAGDAPLAFGNYNGVVVLDFNNDGVPDIASVNNTVAEVWLSNQDSVFPTVSTITPFNNQTAINSLSAISFTFSEDIDPATLINKDANGAAFPNVSSTITIFGATSLYHSGVISVDAANSDFTFTPYSAFIFDEIVTVTITNSVGDPNGNSLGGGVDFTSGFTTRDISNPPTTLIGAVGQNVINLDWTAPTLNVNGTDLLDLDGYNVFKKYTSDAGYNYDVPDNGALIPAGFITYSATGLSNYSTYNFVVRAVDINGNVSIDSNQIVITPDFATPKAPSFQLASSVPNGIYLNWSSDFKNDDGSYFYGPSPPNLDNFSSFNLWRHTSTFASLSTHELGGPPVTLVGTFANVSAIDFTDTVELGGLEYDTPYYYRLTASSTYNNNQTQFPSNEVSAQVTNPAATVALTTSDADFAIPADGVSFLNISAYAEDALSAPVPDGTFMRFSTSCVSGDCGTLSVTDGYTAGGYLVTKLTSGTSSDLIVEVTGITGVIWGVIPTISYTPGSPDSAVFSANTTVLVANGVDSSTITAEIRDVDSALVQDGIKINFLTDFGHFPNTFANITATTSAGRASAQIFSNITSGFPNIVASVLPYGNITGVLLKNFSSTPVQFTPLPAAIGLTAVPTLIPSDGVSTSAITALVRDSLLNPISDGIVVDFSTTNGTLSAPSAVISGGAGLATVDLTSDASPGTGDVKAKWTNTAPPFNVVSSIITVSFVEKPVQMFLTPASYIIPADGGISSTSVEALLLDQFTLPVADGVLVNYSTSTGYFAGSGTSKVTAATTGGLGTATVTIHSTMTPTDFVTITATTAAIVASTEVDIAFKPGPPTLANFSSLPVAIAADGISTTSVSAIVRDALDNLVKDGTAVVLQTTDGTFPNTTQISDVLLTVDGRATTDLTSSVTPGPQTISTNIGGTPFEGISSVTFTEIPTYINIVASATTIAADGVSTSTLTATVFDSTSTIILDDGLPLGFTTTDGTLSAAQAVTSGGAGQAVVSLTSTPVNGSGDVTVEWTNGPTSISAVTTVIFESGPPASVTLSSNKNLCVADNVQKTILTAIVKDAAGDPVNDGYVVDFAEIGNPGLVPVNISVIPGGTVGGVAKAIVTSNISRLLLPAKFVATNLAPGTGTSNEVNVTFMPLDLAPDQVTIFSTGGITSIPADGESCMELGAVVNAPDGLPVPDGYNIAWTTNFGGFTNATTYTAAFEANHVSLTNICSTRVATRPVTVTATAEGITGDTQVNFSPGPPLKIELIKADPSPILANEYDSSLIRVYVTDAAVDGEPVLDGVWVTFDVNTSVLFANGTKTSDAIQTVGGYAEVQVIGYDPGIPNIKVTAGDNVSTIFTALEVITDATNPTITETIPANNSLDVAANSTIQVRFSEYMNQGSVENTAFWNVSGSISGNIAGTVGYTVDDLSTPVIIEAVFTPENNLATKEVVTVDLNAANITDLSNLPLFSSNTTFTFTTIDTGFDVGSITLTVDAPRVFSNGTSFTTLRANVLKSDGTPVADATTVDFTAAGVATIDNVTTTTGGVATAQVKSQTVNLVSFTASVDTGAEIIIDPAPADPPVTVLFYQEPVQLSLSSNKINIIGDGLDSAQLTAGMIDQYSNDVADGLLINYSTSAGVLEFNQVETINGEAEVLLTSIPKFVPSVTVTAWYDEMSAIRSEVQLAFNPGPPDSLFMNVSALPGAIPADGTSTSLINAYIRDAGGNPAKDGLPVTFSVDTSISFYGKFPSGSWISAPVSTSGGVASVVFTSFSTAGVPAFTATVGSATKTDSPLLITAVPTFINITAAPSSNISADGIDYSLITATVTPAATTAGLQVDFTTTNGTLSAPFATITGVSGIASVKLTSTTPNGIADVKAKWTNGFTTISSQPFTVSFSSGAAASLILSVDRTAAAADGNDDAILTALALDSDGNAAVPTKVYFESFDSVPNPIFVNTSATTSIGFGTAFVNASTAGLVNLRARTASGIYADPVTVNFVEPPAQINVITGSSSINGDGLSTTWVTAYLQDQFTTPVLDGIFVNFSTSHGTFLSTASRKVSALTVAGEATVTIISEAISEQPVTITAKTDALAEAITTIDFKPGPPSFLNMSSYPESIPADESTETLIKAYIYDDNNYPVKDDIIVSFLMTTLNATFPNGSQASAPVMTTDGVATITVKAGDLTGQPDITAIVGGTPTLENPLDITDVPDDITLVPAAVNIQGDGISTTTLTATLENSGAAIADADGFVINFTSDDGSLDVASAETVAGMATATLTSEAARIIHASPNIHASWTNGTVTFTADATVDYSPGPSSFINVTSPVNIVETGGDTTKVTATVFDSFGAPVPGVTVDFTAFNSTAPSSGVTNVFGVVTTIYTSGPTELLDDVVATAADSGAATGSYSIYSIDPDHYPASITVSASPISVNADDGRSYTTLTALVLDAYGNFVYNEFPVTFTTLGNGSFFDSVQSPIPGTVNSSIIVNATSGVATVYLYSHNALKRGSAVITAQSLGSVTGQTTVFFRPGPAENISFSAQPPVIAADGLSTSDITIYVRDALAGGTSDILSATVLTDIKRNWVPDELIGMYLNPDSTQETSFKITSNTVNTITTAGDMLSVATVADSYTVSSTGVSTGLNDVVLTDISASWTPGLLTGLNLNPNINQNAVFRIVDNTLTTITVANLGMESVATAGVDTYEIVGDLIKDGLTATFSTVSSVFLNDTQTSEAIDIIGGTAVVTLKSGTTPANPLISAQIGQLVQYARPVTLAGLPDAIFASATSTVIAADGLDYSVIVAHMTSGGSDVDEGYEVEFSTTLGSLSAPFANVTGTNGNAAVLLTSEASNGSALVKARWTNNAFTTISSIVQVDFTSGSPATVVLDSNATFAGYSSTITLTAEVKDASGFNVNDNTEVYFTNISGSGIFGSATSLTIGGFATQTVTALSTGQVKVRSSSGGIDSNTIDLTFVEPARQMTVYADAGSIAADGVSTSTISALLQDKSGTNVANGFFVNFSTSAGTFLTTGDNKAGATTTNGIATVDLRSIATLTSGVVITAVTDGAGTASTTLDFKPGPPDAGFSNISAFPAAIVGDGVSQSVITAYLRDDGDNFVKDGVAVIFQAYSSGEAVTTTNYGSFPNGLATSVPVLTAGGKASVAFTSENGATGQPEFKALFAGKIKLAQPLFITPLPHFINMSALPDTIAADGVTPSEIRAYVYDNTSTIISDGLDIDFITTKGTLSATRAAITSGVASVLLTSESINTTGDVTASWTNGTSTVTSSPITITFYSGEASQISLTSDKIKTVADGLQQVLLTAEVRDSAGGFVNDGKLVGFSDVSLPAFVNISVIDMDGAGIRLKGETVGGIAKAIVTSIVEGIATLKVENEAPGSGEATVDVGFIHSDFAPVQVTLSAADPKIPADGSSTTTITATLNDKFSNLVTDDLTVYFKTSKGLFPNLSSFSAPVLTKDGFATIEITSDLVPGFANISAFSEGEDGSGQVQFSPGPPDSISISYSKVTLFANQVDTSIVKASVKDVDSEAVKDGLYVTFSVNPATPFIRFANGTLVSDPIPTGNVEPGTGIAEVLVYGWQDGAGTPVDITATIGLESQLSQLLQVLRDTVRPTVTSTIPANLAEEIDPNTTITAIFSEKMDKNSVEDTAFWNVSGTGSGNVTATGTVTYTEVGSVYAAVFQPQQAFQDGEDVSFALYSGMTDLPPELNPLREDTGARAGTFKTTVSQSGITKTITLVSDKEKVQANNFDTVEFTATPLDKDGLPVTEGTLIDFNVTSGTASPATAQVAVSGGVAKTTFKSGTVGLVEVTVTPVTGEGTASWTVFFVEEPKQLTLQTNKLVINGDGIDTATLTAIVLDANGSFVADGLFINYSTSDGALSALQVETLGGKATVTLTSLPELKDPVTVTAWYADNLAVRGSTQLAFSPGPPDSGKITISSSPDAIPADGVSSAEISAYLTDTGDNPVKDGTLVTFSVNSTIYGKFPNGTGTSNTSPTSGGTATVVFNVATTVGWPTISAQVGLANYSSDTALYISEVPTFINISASPISIAADGVDESTLTIDMKDGSGTEIPDGLLIEIETTGGTLKNSFTNVSGVQFLTAAINTAGCGGVPGRACVKLRSTTSNGSGEITARWIDNRTDPATVLSDVVTVQFQSGAAQNITLASDWTQAVANGTENVLIRGYVTDQDGNGVANGSQVQFSNASSIAFPFVNISTADGTDIALTSGGWAEVFVNATTVGTLTLLAENLAPGSGSGTISIDFLDPLLGPAQLTLSTDALNNEIAADGQSTATITATINAGSGNPVGDGFFVSFVTSHGTFVSTGTNTAGVYTLGGVATAVIKSTTSKILGVNITATSEGASGNTQIDFSPGSPGSISIISVSDTNIYANQVDTSIIRAYVTDGTDPVVDNLFVTFNVTTSVQFTNGTKTSAAVPTLGGYAEAVVFGYYSGVPSITATIGTLTSSAYTNLIVSPDNDKPLILSTLPSGGESDVAVDTDIRVNFSEFMNVSSVQSQSFWNISGSSSGNTTGSIVYTYDGTILPVVSQAVFTPQTPFDNSETVSVDLLAASIIDISNNPVFSASTSFSFDIESLGADVASVDLSVSPEKVIADTIATATLTANVLKTDGSPVENGTIVNFNVTGTATISNVQTTTAGIATALVSSGTIGLASFTADVDTGVTVISSSSIDVLFYREPKQLMLTSDSLVINGDGIDTATITALLVDEVGNDVADGLFVNFSTSAGALSSQKAATAGGEAVITITSLPALEPTVFVTAWYEDDETVRSSVQLAFSPGPAHVQYMNISSTPIAVPADGVSNALLTAYVRDIGGNPVKDGLNVTLRVDDSKFGKFPSGNGTSGPISTSGGKASVFFNVSTFTGDPEFYAQIGLTNYSSSDSLKLTAVPAFINITASPISIAADGVDESILTVYLRELDGVTPIPDGVLVEIETTGGTLENAVTNVSGVQLLTAAINGCGGPGTACVTLKSTTSNGSGDITARWLDNRTDPATVLSDVVTVQFQSGAAQNITLVSDKLQSVANGSENVLIRGYVTDQDGNGVADGSQVQFSNASSIAFPFVNISTADGTDIALTSGGWAEVFVNATTVGTLTLLAENLAPGSGSETISIDFLDPLLGPAQLTLSTDALNNEIAADGQSTATITATINDSGGLTVAEDFFVNFSTSEGTFVSTGTNRAGAYTDAAGIALAVLQSSTTRTLGVNITATSEGVTGSTQIDFSPGSPSSISIISVSEPNIYANQVDTSIIRAYVTDGTDPVVDNLFVTFNVTTSVQFTNGTKTSAAVPTSGGYAEAVVFGYYSGVPSITATIGALTSPSFTGLVVSPDNVNPSILSTLPSDGGVDIPIDTDISVNFSEFMNVSSVQSLSFWDISGSLSGNTTGSVVYTYDGTSSPIVSRAVFTPQTPFDNGETVSVDLAAISIIDISDNPVFSASTSFSFDTQALGADVASVALSALPLKQISDGSLITLTVNVLKVDGSPVSDGTQVDFNYTGAASLSSSFATTIAGLATIDVSSGSVGTVSITASVDTGTTIVLSSPVDVIFYQLPVQVSLLTDAVGGKIPGDGISTATITAKINDQYGNSVAAGLDVTFALLSSSDGSLSASTVQTNASGEATVLLTSVAKLLNNNIITATCEGIDGVTSVSYNPGPPDSAGITFRADPVTIYADGISTSTIYADITDEGGNPVRDGYDITFDIATTTAIGRFDSGLLTSYPAPTVGGSASVTFTAATTVGWPEFYAQVGSAVNLVPGTPLEIVAVPIPTTISISATPSIIPSDGASTSVISVVATDGGGTAIPDGIFINFSATAGTLNKKSAVISGGFGQAEVVLTAENFDATADMFAYWTDGFAGISSSHIPVQFLSEAPAQVGLSISPVKIPADGVSEATITAFVNDVDGYPVVDGKIVTFFSSHGDISGGDVSPSQASTTGGFATVTITSGKTLNDAVTITASVSGVAPQNTTMKFNPGPAKSMTFAVDPAQIYNNGQDEALITVSLWDGLSGLGNPVKDGLLVTLSTNKGEFSNGTKTSNPISTLNGDVSASMTALSNYSGFTNISGFIGLLKSTDVGPEIITDTTSPSVFAYSTYTSASVNAPIWAQFTEVIDAGTLNSTNFSVVDSSGVINGNYVFDPISSIATFTPSSPYTPGETITVNLTAGIKDLAIPANGLVSFSWNFPVESIGVGSLLLTTDRSVIAKDGSYAATITAEVRDGAGALIPNSPGFNFVTFSIDSGLGSLSATDVDTVNGVASVQLTSVFVNDIIVRAVPTGSSLQETVTISSVSVPAQITLNVTDPDWIIPGDGTSTTTITATVRDSLGFFVDDGLVIDFITSKGTLSSPSALTSGGKATVTITSAPELDTAVQLEASCALGVPLTSINFMKFQPGPPKTGNTIAITSDNLLMVANGYDTANLTATVYDDGSNPVKDGLEVTFTTDRGTFPNGNVISAPVLITGGNGEATIVLTSGIYSATVTADITAQIGAAFGSLGSLQMTLDDIAPLVLSNNPTAGSNTATLANPVTVTFDERMDLTSLTNAFSVFAFTPPRFISGNVAQSYDALNNIHTATFTPTTPYTSNEDILVTVKGFPDGSAAEDYAGNPMAANYTWTFTTTETTAPAAPTGLTANPGNSFIDLVWTEPTLNSDATALTDLVGYNIYRSLTAGAYVQIATVLEPATTYQDNSAVNDTTYYYVVTAFDDKIPANESVQSVFASATPSSETPPAAPTGLNGTFANGQVFLNWSANTEPDLAGYDVYMGDAFGFYSSGDMSGSLVNASLVVGESFSVANLPPALGGTPLVTGDTYMVVVTAVDTVTPIPFESAISPEISVVEAAPVAPTGLVVTPQLGNTIDLIWNANTEVDLAGYNVYMGTTFGFYSSGDMSANKVNAATLTGTAYTVTALPAALGGTAPVTGITYYVAITAIDTVTPTPFESLASTAVSTTAISNIANLDGVGVVDGGDLAILAAAYGLRSTDADWSTTNCAAYLCSTADLDGSGRVDGEDLYIMSINFGL